MKKIVYLIIFLTLSCSSSNESEKLLDAVVLSGHTGTKEVTLNWDFGIDNEVNVLEVTIGVSLDGDSFESTIVNADRSYTVDGLNCLG